MTTRPTNPAVSAPDFIQLPDPPEPEDMNNTTYLHLPGNSHYLADYLGNPETTIVTSEAYIQPEPGPVGPGSYYPDLLVAFNVHPARCLERNGYVISDQGKPPDFVLEIGSKDSGRRDTTIKRGRYAELGVPEYWRFDHTGGQYHGQPLAGDRLVNGIYEPIPIEGLEDGSLQGYSQILGLNLRWERGYLGWYNPATGEHIPRLQDERERANAELEARRQAEARAEAERRARVQAESRVRELEEQLQRKLPPAP